ncbi:unnamed protein product [Durusdinium trenchii]|uniref:Uncharacterized protein n=1 Tax=Durusdinium trenchii TaxID=1381693 RepID=A0ABP0S8G8_9DINO
MHLVTTPSTKGHEEEFNEVTSKYALLFQEIEQKLLHMDHRIHSLVLASDQQWSHHEVRHQRLEGRLEALEGLRLHGRVAQSGSPESFRHSAVHGKEMNGEAKQLVEPGRGAVGDVRTSRGRPARTSSEVSTSSKETLSFNGVFSNSLNDCRSSVSQILVRLAGVESQLQELKKILGESKSQQQESLDRYHKLICKESKMAERIDVLQQEVSLMSETTKKRNFLVEEHGDVHLSRLEKLERQLVGLSKESTDMQLEQKHLRRCVGRCEQIKNDMPTLGSIEEEVQSAHVREAALSERLDYVLKLASSKTSFSDASKADIRALVQSELTKHVELEGLRAVTTQHTLQLEALRHEIGGQSARGSEDLKHLRHSIADTDASLQHVLESKETLERAALATSKRLDELDAQITCNKEQRVQSEIELFASHHKFQAALQKQTVRTQSLEERLVRCECLLSRTSPLL